MRTFRAAPVLLIPFAAGIACFAEEAPKAEPSAARTGEIVVQSGTRIPLSMINSVSTKNASDGDRVYLETVFPIMVNGRMAIPPGSYVAGTITQVKRPGRVKGRGELFLRFDSLTLPNGVTRDFRASVGTLDGRSNEKVDRKEGKIQSDGSKGDDARVIAETTGAGTSIGALAGSAAGHAGLGAGIGAAAGAAAGLMGVMLTRGQEAVLTKGTTLEMVLDRPIQYDESELAPPPVARRPASDGDGPAPAKRNDILRPRTPSPVSRYPL
jgi:type IV secretion system protein VirB10